MEYDKINREISGCESLIMKIVWESDGDISTQQLMEELNTKFDKKYARTTVVTLVQRLVEKEFVKTYRNGRASYVHATKSKEEYLKKYFTDAVYLWFDGDFNKLAQMGI
jgi:predicted transcriptional regulator